MNYYDVLGFLLMPTRRRSEALSEISRDGIILTRVKDRPSRGSAK